MKLAGKVAFVTGAGSDRGIGWAVAHGLAREGASLALVDIDSTAVEAAATSIRNQGGKALAMALDVSQREKVRGAIARAEERFGQIDIAVNNAGFCTFRPYLEIDDELWDRTLAVNLKGYFICGQEAARSMIQHKVRGKIINISSVSAETSGEEKVHYSVSKAGIKSLTLGMALELARHHINVNAVAPGVIDTNIIKELRIQRLVEHEREHSSVPWGRIGQAEDIVGAALFLASEEADYITGATILVDGGLSAGTLMPH